MDVNSGFDEAVLLEHTLKQEGFDEGFKAGLVAGKEDAIQVGLKKGFEDGEELGFYKGCVDVWSSAIRADPTHFSPRVQKAVKQMVELIEKCPLTETDSKSFEFQETLEALRLKFRAVCSSLGVKLEYNGYPKAASVANDMSY